jgi:hypothetical protein
MAPLTNSNDGNAKRGPLTNREKQIRKRAKKRAEMGEDAHKAEEAQRRRNDRVIGKAISNDPTLAVVQMILKTKVTASKQAHKARASESKGLLVAVEQNHAARATENTQLDGVLGNILKTTASQNARQPVAFEPDASEEGEVDDEPEREPDVLDEDDYVDDILELEHDNRQPNAHWKPKRRDRIVLPLTDEHRVIPFNMEEDMCLTTMAARLLQEAIEDFLPSVQPKPGLGSVIAQVQHDLPFPVRKDLWYIRQGRVTIQHEKNASTRWRCRITLQSTRRRWFESLEPSAPTGNSNITIVKPSVSVLPRTLLSPTRTIISRIWSDSLRTRSDSLRTRSDSLRTNVAARTRKKGTVDTGAPNAPVVGTTSVTVTMRRMTIKSIHTAAQ